MVRHVIDYADGWFPNHAGAEVDEVLDRLHREAEANSRDPSTVRFMVPGPAKAAFLETQQARGCERVLLPLPSAPRDVVLPILDRHAKTAQEWNEVTK